MTLCLSRSGLLFIHLSICALPLYPAAAHAHDLMGLAATRYPVLVPAVNTAAGPNVPPAASLSAAAKSNVLKLSKLRTDKDTAIVIASNLGGSPATVSARGLTSTELSALQSVVMNAKTWPPGKTIKVCFYEPAANRARIATIAAQWLQFGNVKFDFGAPPDLRTCGGSGESSEIRITFRERLPYWVGYASLIGTDSAINKGEPSMVLRDFDQADLDDPYFQSVVLHEFGHALGFHHEHQSPAADCERQFNIPEIKRRTGWSDEQVRTNLNRLQVSSMSGVKDGFTVVTQLSGEPFAFSPYDPKSIMHYSLPLEVFRSPVGSCYVPQNLTLSEIDQKGMTTAYPVVNYQTHIRELNKKIEMLISSGKLSSMETAALRVLKRN